MAKQLIRLLQNLESLSVQSITYKLQLNS